MSEEPHFRLNIGEMIQAYNRAKELTINALIDEKLLTKEEGDRWKSNHLISLHKNSWLGEMWEKLHGKDEDLTLHVRVVKLVDSNEGKSNGKADKEGTESGDLARFESH